MRLCPDIAPGILPSSAPCLQRAAPALVMAGFTIAADDPGEGCARSLFDADAAPNAAITTRLKRSERTPPSQPPSVEAKSVTLLTRPASMLLTCQLAIKAGITRLNICMSRGSSDQPPRQAQKVRRSKVVLWRIHFRKTHLPRPFASAMLTSELHSLLNHRPSVLRISSNTLGSVRTQQPMGPSWRRSVSARRLACSSRADSLISPIALAAKLAAHGAPPSTPLYRVEYGKATRGFGEKTSLIASVSF